MTALRILLGSLVRVSFLAKVCIVSDQTSEAGNVKCCPELHARSRLSFVIRPPEDPSIVPSRGLEWAIDPRNYGHPSEG